MKNSAIYERDLEENWPLSGKEVEWNGKEPFQEHILVWGNLLCNIYFLNKYNIFFKFSRYKLFGLDLCLFFLSDFNQIFKDKFSAWMGHTFGAIFSLRLYVTVYYWRRAVLLVIFRNLVVTVSPGKNFNFLVTASPCAFLLMETIPFNGSHYLFLCV